MFSVPVTFAPFRTSWPPTCALSKFTSSFGTLVHEQMAADARRIHVQRAGDLGANQGKLAPNVSAAQDYVDELGALADGKQMAADVG